MGTITGRFGTAVFAFLTGVVLPVMLQVLATNYKISLPAHNEATAPAPAIASPVVAYSPELKMTAQGIGRSAEEAWRDGVRKGLQSATAFLVDGQTWSQSSTLICEQVLQDEKSIVLRCEDGRCVPEGGVWRRDVTVVVSRSNLADSLRSFRWRVVTDAR